MRLLVSVRDADEAVSAITAGADIIDAKEPMLGPLAPVSPAMLQSISAAVPLSQPFSVALGDAEPASLAGLVSGVAPLSRRHALFFKAAVIAETPDAAAAGIAAACRRLAARPDQPQLVVAQYVDGPGGNVALRRWVEVAAAAGARGLLLDTSVKAGSGVFGAVGVQALAALRRHAARRGIWLAVAGGVTIENMELLAAIRPHVVGVRGAVCQGERTGTLSAARVTHLCQALAAINARELRALPASPH